MRFGGALAAPLFFAGAQRCLSALRGILWPLNDWSRIFQLKVFGIAGFSGSGKTTLLEKLIPEFRSRGLRVSVIKHTHHRFDLDKPGKDSWRHREAGAEEVLVLSGDRWVLMHELRGEPEPSLEEQLC